ncbi:MAG TPA: Re/Si-specific NAD(P)(+) transhydrogenase subunit alpha [Thermoanaerobaculia bacterium]|nr:Re/Si-specific NAD(P)(+) transhydrogenase subunit alpha [Thermoanaerobaculia bacterium]
MTKIWVPKEQHPGERRVAATPETVKRLVKDGLTVALESGAGEGAHHSDEEYRQAGAEVASDRKAGWQSADIVFKVREPSEEEAGWLKQGAILVALMAAHKNLSRVEQLAKGGVTTFAMELVPRITRAQAVDALSSQASIAGYKAVLIAAARLSKYFPLLMTAAGTVPPARVVVMGAGVAGLQAIATARRLGAVVEVSDIRAAVKEEVESLGGRFIELPIAESGEGQGGYAKEMSEDFLRRQREIVARHLAAADVVITTALVPGRPAPRLVSREMVEGMKHGSIIVDLASSEGGNCELSKADEEVMHHGVLILAPSNLASAQSVDSSALYAKNLVNLLALMWQKGELKVDVTDEVLAGTLLTHEGKVTHAPTAARLQTPA